jgi:hypothetical protein
MRTLALILAFLVGGLTPNRSAQAQSSGSAPLTFDLLQAARSADSLRTVVSRQRGEIARLHKTVGALSDSIKSTRKTVDTVHLIATRVDTVRLDSVKSPNASASPAAKPAGTAPAAAAVTFSAPLFTGLLQVWAFGGDASYRSTVRIRRAEVKLVSDLGRRARATVVFDIAKSLSLSTSGSGGQVSVSQSSRALQDGFISLPVRRVQIDAGQQKIPLGYEGMQSSSGLESAERALMFSDRARGGSFGDIRDLGIVARGALRWVEYHAGVFNGSGENQNEVDRNVGKSAIGRLAVKVPGIRALQLGGSAATSGAATIDKPTRDRVGAEVVYRYRAFSLQAEGMRGQDGTVVRRGAYVLTAFGVTPRVRVHARADAWDPDVSSENGGATATERDYLAGVTWLPAATRLKLQLVGVRKTYTRNIVPAATQAIITMQASW